MQQLLATKRMFDEAGLATAMISTGGTGSVDIGSAMDGITEIQAARTR